MKKLACMAVGVLLLSGCGDSEETKQRISFVERYRAACIQEKKPYQCEYDIQILTALWGAKESADNASAFAAGAMGMAAGSMAGGARR